MGWVYVLPPLMNATSDLPIRNVADGCSSC